MALSGGLDAVALPALVAPERPGWFYVPDTSISMPLVDLEVGASKLEVLRAAAVTAVPSARLESALRVPAPAPIPASAQGGKWAAKLFSEALATYCADPDGLPKTLASVVEQRQRQAGMMLFAEFMGDLPLGEIDGDKLRAYRDGPLKTFPGRANHLPKAMRRTTMKETIEALKKVRPDWPPMTADMQRERMLWLFRFADMPDVCPRTDEGRMLLLSMANFAEFEGRRIGTRTKAAIAAKKRRVELGCDDKAPGITDWKKVWGVAGAANLRQNIEERRDAANAFAAKLHQTLAGFQARGLTQRQMVAELNTVGIKTARGGEWSLVQVQRVLARLKVT